MIGLASEFDLGRDKTRMKNASDIDRQTTTARVILERLYSPDDEKRWDLQLLADEVGMGKTFVALGVVYSVLAALRDGGAHPLGCSSRSPVLVIAPSLTLAKKWEREVGEFVRRCMEDHDAEIAKRWFTSSLLDRPDTLARALRYPEEYSPVLVTYMDVLGSNRKLLHYELKRRATLSALFRVWANRLPNETRLRLLKGAPDGWARDPAELDRFSKEELALLGTRSIDELVQILRQLVQADPGAKARSDSLLETCKEIGAKFARNRDDRFNELSRDLNQLYRDAAFVGIQTRLPLVVVDEAHNWKNGPEGGVNGYGGFHTSIAPLARRALLLTATPFQLRPAEMLQLLRVGEGLRPSEDQESRKRGHQRMADHRETVIEPVLRRAAEQSRVFAKAWAMLTPETAAALGDAWRTPVLVGARAMLKALAHAEGAVGEVEVRQEIDRVIDEFNEEIRRILRAGLHLYALNEDASQELGAFVIRHRRATDHRCIAVGHEFVATNGKLANRADRHVLHASPGLEVSGDAELPHYLLMRCVSEIKGGRGRSSLGSALTGCYSTLLSSADGRTLRKKLEGGPGTLYLDLLKEMVSEAKDPEHPKVASVVNAVMESWRAGKKTLLFCFRTNTAERLTQIIGNAIKAELDSRRERISSGSDSLRNLRSRLTRRDDELVGLGLDRVLWSILWAARSADIALPDLAQDDFIPTDEDLHHVAALALRFEVRFEGDDLDRVFLHRAVESVIAARLARRIGGGPFYKHLLAEIAQPTWVQYPYGLDPQASSGTESENGGDEEDDRDDAETSGLDARGVHVVYRERGTEPTAHEIAELAAALVLRRQRATEQGAVSVFDTYARAPSFWIGPDPAKALSDSTDRISRTLTSLHSHLLLLSREKDGFAWAERGAVLHALRRAVLRESVLLRILPTRAEIDRDGWAKTLVDALFHRLPGQSESMADRISVFVEDIQSATGKVFEENSMRRSMYEGARLEGSDQIALVRGDTGPDRRERLFAGFNSPLLPEVLVCTSVGQEGIDLHRHCRNVIHYDLAWNPAVIEQRTGRVDRIGSKAFRERGENPDAFLDVGVPFLAGTYDERMYEEIRIRAQTFEVLTGGDLSADNVEGHDDGENAEGHEQGLEHPMLPSEMLNDLRVRLHVWPTGGV